MAEFEVPEYIFETSWEVCNMVGGIYTVCRRALQHSSKNIRIN